MGAVAVSLATDLRRRIQGWTRERSAGVLPRRGVTGPTASRGIANARVVTRSVSAGGDVTGVVIGDGSKVPAEGQDARGVNEGHVEGQEARGVADTS